MDTLRMITEAKRRQDSHENTGYSFVLDGAAQIPGKIEEIHAGEGHFTLKTTALGEEEERVMISLNRVICVVLHGWEPKEEKPKFA